MKKKVILSFFCLCIFLLVSLNIYFYMHIQNLDKKIIKLNVESTFTYPEIYDVLDSITVKNFEDSIGDTDLSFIGYIGRPNCFDCNEFEPELIKLIESNSKYKSIKYINVLKLNKNENEWDLFKKEYNIQYTPTLIKVDNGKIIKKIEWTPANGLYFEDVKDWLNINI